MVPVLKMGGQGLSHATSILNNAILKEDMLAVQTNTVPMKIILIITMGILNLIEAE